ncbi:MAG: hypothetical protein U9N45_03020, partial [Gemmatimonadota bacterium]|nr:hypothetical protein [Gemmatimonadota bacterium]
RTFNRKINGVIKMGEKFTGDMTLSEVAGTSPKARDIIEKYFGRACFDCPSFTDEPLFIGARMHAIDLDKMLSELNSTG